MPYLVKPVNGEERRLELPQIHDALKNGLITEKWLVRDERQTVWYSIGKLVGTTASQPIPLACPFCGTSIPARHIDIGLPLPCPQCRKEVVVPDPLVLTRRSHDQSALDNAKTQVLIGVGLFVIGVGLSSFFYFLRGSDGIWLLWHGPITVGFLLCAWYVPNYFSVKKRLAKPVSMPPAAK